MSTPPQNPLNESIERAQAILKDLPAWVWNTTTPPTLIRIRNNIAEYVPKDYVGQPDDFVFRFSNLNGFISIQKIYPPNE